MFECLIVGDNIGNGIAMAKPECINVVTNNVNSWDFYNKSIVRPAIGLMNYRYVVISIGTNDHDGIDTEQNIMNIRTKVNGDRVIWILPSATKRRKQHEIVKKYAIECGDIFIDIHQYTGKDDINPTSMDSYKKLSGEINWRLKR